MGGVARAIACRHDGVVGELLALALSFTPWPVDGALASAINTLALDIKTAVFRPIERTGPNAPDYRVYAGKVEQGASWAKTGDNTEFSL